MSTDTKSVERLALKFMSQVGDDVQEFYSHEALFKIGAETMRALVAERDAATARVAELEARLAEAEDVCTNLRDDMLERARFGIDVIRGEQYRIVNAGNSAWMAFTDFLAKKESRDG
ncbi:hypothetical protein JF540_22705 [Salipiger thiooxidans]|uniref:hypothetical protein n=1 Tax=Salipiger thiooxidans TaxID=282683 RepID=UPI001A8F6193|nr:hypothetical protein [Salipiger thiooxidans]MBN8189500.1 hypothetical protein [Salipiger thiooxidans]